ncbi:hypothetical protein [Pimelobacter sp. 30-1]|nr:hypothetical protein [Pimelobacter sp. 30-1]
MTKTAQAEAAPQAAKEYPRLHELTVMQAEALIEKGKPVYCVDTPGATHASLFASKHRAHQAAAFCGVHEVYDWLTHEIV